MILFTFLAALSTDAAKACPLPIIEHAEVAQITDGASFDLKDGRRVRLAAVLPPRAGEPLADDARRLLATALEGWPVALAFDRRTTDRHGALIAFVFAGDTWVQHALVTAGLARVRTDAETASCATPLLEGEKSARETKNGIWALPAYRVRTTADLEADIGTFQIVEGKVASVAMSKGRAFVNFGADYRTDFTVTIAARDLRRLAKDGVDPATWTGKQIRVRGWLSRLNGPEIELTHAAQIQIIE
jgi:micrococcal nuclease